MATTGTQFKGNQLEGLATKEREFGAGTLIPAARGGRTQGLRNAAPGKRPRVAFPTWPRQVFRQAGSECLCRNSGKPTYRSTPDNYCNYTPFLPHGQAIRLKQPTRNPEFFRGGHVLRFRAAKSVRVPRQLRHNTHATSSLRVFGSPSLSCRGGPVCPPDHIARSTITIVGAGPRACPSSVGARPCLARKHRAKHNRER